MRAAPLSGPALVWRLLVQPLSTQRLHIVSANNFPTAAGLASSASGYAALVFTLATLFELPLSPTELSKIARQGSGSACRSVMGGYVAWQAGTAEDGCDSVAVEIAPVGRWPELEALICVVDGAKKAVPSTVGMKRTMATSSLIRHRVSDVVPARMAALAAAINARDFGAFAEETMADSNSFHACCLDSRPPIFYLNDTSRALIALVVELNRAAGRAVAAYTFDAGPNAVIFALPEEMAAVATAVLRFFAPASTFSDSKGLLKREGAKAPFVEALDASAIPGRPAGSVKQLIHTGVGDGPRRLSEAASLVDAAGMPKATA